LALVDGVEPSVSLFDVRHRLIWIVAVLVGGMMAAILYIPVFAAIFRVAPLSVEQLGLAFAVASITGGWFGIGRLVLRYSDRRAKGPAVRVS
jgi:Cation transporting ATPase, C-terminus